MKRPIPEAPAAFGTPAKKQYLTESVTTQLAEGKSAGEVAFDLTLGTLRDKVPLWLHGALQEVSKEDVLKGVKHIGLDRCWSVDLVREAERADDLGLLFEGEGEELQELGEEEESDGGSDEDDDLPIGQLLERALESSDSESDAE